MDSIIKFRILIDNEGDEEIFRDIEILGSQTFDELHKEIQKSFSFDAAQMASFYMSNDNWDKGQEIPLMKMDFDDGSTSLEMKDTLINQMVQEKNQKIVYVFDFLLMWCFFVEVVEITPYKTSDKNKYPRCVLTYGDAPDQYSREVKLDPDDDKLMLKNRRDLKRDPFADDPFNEFDDFERSKYDDEHDDDDEYNEENIDPYKDDDDY